MRQYSELKGRSVELVGTVELTQHLARHPRGKHASGDVFVYYTACPYHATLAYLDTAAHGGVGPYPNIVGNGDGRRV